MTAGSERAVRAGALSVVVLLLPLASPGAAQVPANDAADRFVEAAEAATRRLASVEAAVRAGYRRLGPDFPGMGEHWVEPGLVVRGELDASRPPVLTFVPVDGERVLAGVAYTIPLGPRDQPPEEPFGRDVWHDHSSAVDEETLLLSHRSSMHAAPDGPRLSMIHVWTAVPNPDGLLAQNNWRLPFLRAGISPPRDPRRDAARGLSLGGSGQEFYRRLIDRATPLEPAVRARVFAALEKWSARVDSDVAAARGSVETEISQHTLEARWRDFWAEVRAIVPGEAWTDLAPLAGTGG